MKQQLISDNLVASSSSLLEIESQFRRQREAKPKSNSNILLDNEDLKLTMNAKDKWRLIRGDNPRPINMRRQEDLLVCQREDLAVPPRSFVASIFKTVLISEALLLLALLTLTSEQFIGMAEAIKLQPEGREKFYWSGEQFVITCQNNNNIKNVKIRWIGPNGMDITEDKSQRVHAASTGPHGNRLHVMNATASTDDGQYKCTLGSADDKNPREHIEFNLKIYKTTSFKETPKHVTLPVGSQGTLNCRIEFDQSVSQASVEWFRDSLPIERYKDIFAHPSTYTVIDYDPNKQLSQLIISPLTKENEGIYTCRAVAEATQLSKISEHNIQLETNYAPAFDSMTQTVWVERSVQGSSGASSSQNSRISNVYNNNQRGGRFKAGSNKQASYLPPPGARRGPDDQAGSEESANQLQANQTNIIQVELRCTCQANPPASILWSSNENSRYVLTKGEPAHVLEEPRTEINGHNTTSVLIIGYSPDPDWPHRQAEYFCSASNMFGTAVKKFDIRQGDLPPAYHVQLTKTPYSPTTSQFKLTLIGPNLDPENSQQLLSQQSQDIVPPVDSFRIRAENSASGSDSSMMVKQGGHHKSRKHHHQQHQQQQLNEAMSVVLPLNGDQVNRSKALTLPRNFTVGISKLPPGNQKLYLEAHNAVGWSPNATYLGEYYIVSGASSLSSSAVAIMALAWSSVIASLLFSTQMDGINFC